MKQKNIAPYTSNIFSIMSDQEDYRTHRDSPLHKQAWEIMQLANNLVESLPDRAPNADLDNNEELMMKMHYGGKHAQLSWEDHKKWIIECAGTIPVKIAGAEGADLYDIYYEQAAIIRKACRELVVNMRGLESCGYTEKGYMDLIRTAVEKEFKPLFREWVATFADKEFIPDSWGLFNPIGVNWDSEY